MSDEWIDKASSDKYSGLLSAWNDIDNVPFDVWVMNVSESYFRAGIGLNFAARLLNIRPAELQAALNLAILDEDDLSLLVDLDPPNTTWFGLASASTEALQAAILALRNASGDKSPASLVDEAIKTISGPSSLERISALSSEAFGHAAKKAQAYDLLPEKSRKALKNWQSNIRTGRGLTPSQAAYAKSLLQQLCDGGAIVRNSADGDQEICDQILDALNAS